MKRVLIAMALCASLVYSNDSKAVEYSQAQVSAMMLTSRYAGCMEASLVIMTTRGRIPKADYDIVHKACIDNAWENADSKSLAADSMVVRVTKAVVDEIQDRMINRFVQ